AACAAVRSATRVSSLAFVLLPSACHSRPGRSHTNPTRERGSPPPRSSAHLSPTRQLGSPLPRSRVGLVSDRARQRCCARSSSSGQASSIRLSCSSHKLAKLYCWTRSPPLTPLANTRKPGKPRTLHRRMQIAHEQDIYVSRGVRKGDRTLGSALKTGAVLTV